MPARSLTIGACTQAALEVFHAELEAELSDWSAEEEVQAVSVIHIVCLLPGRLQIRFCSACLLYRPCCPIPHTL